MLNHDVAAFSANVLISYSKNYIYIIHVLKNVNNSSEASSLTYNQAPVNG